MNQDFDDHVRELCRRATVAQDAAELQDILSQVRNALRKHMIGLRGMVADYVLNRADHPRWGDEAESDAPQHDARQPYLRRERESAEGFVTWVRLNTPKDPGKFGNPS